MTWRTIPVSDAAIERAKKLREWRDERYGNVFSVRKTDERWVGEVGEIVLDAWLRARWRAGTGQAHYWSQQVARGVPDYWVGVTSLDLKTIKRQDPPKPHYTQQVTARHAHEDVDYFAFATYVVSEQRLYLHGAIERLQFLANAKYIGGGQAVHEHFQVRDDHNIYNVGYKHLMPLTDWATQVEADAVQQGLPRSAVRVRQSAMPLRDQYTVDVFF
jgi:hypothetical protein